MAVYGLSNEEIKARVQRHTTDIQPCLDPKGYVANKLFQDHILTDGEFNTINSIGERKDRCDKLLAILREKPEGTNLEPYVHLREALNKDYGYLVEIINEIVTVDATPNERINNKVRKMFAKIQPTIEPRGHILNKLFETEVLTDAEFGRLNDIPDKHDQTNRMFSILRDKPATANAFVHFRKALQKEYNWMVKMIDEEELYDLQDFQHDGAMKDLEVNVESYDLEKDELKQKVAYPIDISKPNGRAYIINVNKVGNLPERSGTNKDRDYLEALFKGLGFTVTVYNDGHGLSAKEIEDKVKRMVEIENEKKDAQCFVLCILSHGKTLRQEGDTEGLNDEGAFYGTDHKLVKNNTLFEILNDEKCPGLEGKPRLIFFQACRSISTVERDDGIFSHFLVGYPAQTGQSAFRYRGGAGSVYFRRLTQEFMKNACKSSLAEMLDNVRSKLKDKTYNGTERMVPETVSKLKEDFYFFPRKF